jgi:putative two-component system response regulator
MKKSKTILLYEDDPGYAQQYMIALRLSRFVVFWYTNPDKDFCALVSEKRPDIISFDVTMPVMDGFAAAEMLRADVRTRDIPFVFLTNMDIEEYKKRGLSLGARTYCIKSKTSPDDFVRIVNSIIGS